MMSFSFAVKSQLVYYLMPCVLSAFSQQLAMVVVIAAVVGVFACNREASSSSFMLLLVFSLFLCFQKDPHLQEITRLQQELKEAREMQKSNVSAAAAVTFSS